MTGTASPQAELVGAILSRKYRLDRFIGAGGMGAVYATKSPEDGRPLAVKLLAVEHLHEEDVKARFLDEGRMCQRLIHPNIVRVFDVAQAEDGTPYIVMELLDGVPLSAYTGSNLRVPLPQAAAILQGILAGLGAAHAQGLVHRDLKPENVVLARDAGGAYAAKILDFGIAKVMDAAGGMGSRTRTGALLGTPAYMSPEQIRNAKDVDARTDLWSAGVLLYEMLTGRVAFPAPTEYARLGAVLNTTPPALETIDPQLARLSAFVQLAMQKDRAQRFQSALEMARALTAAIGAEPQVGHAGGTPLSRLPDVPSVWMPSATGMSPAAQSGSSPPLPPATQAHRSAPPPAPEPITKGPGGTLASPLGRPSSEPPPQIHVVPGAVQGTLPSENLPMLSAPKERVHIIEDERVAGARARGGVAPTLVAMLVAAALVVGFVLGFAAARML